MKITLTVLFLVAMVVSTTQTFRHIYVKWIASNDSVLDQFANEVDSDITEAESIEELVVLYRKAREDTEKIVSSQDRPRLEQFRHTNAEYDMSAMKIKMEIEARERNAKQLFELCFYWTCGLFSLLAGIFVFNKINIWLGLAGIITGFAEMLWWTSPLFRHRTLNQQFEVLLNYN